MRIIDRIDPDKPFISLEFFPPKEEDKWPAFYEVVEQLKPVNPLFVSVTYGAGGTTQKGTLALCKRIRNEIGLDPMAHFTCVGASRESIREFLDTLAEANVSNVLALRGDPPKGETSFVPDSEEFQHASDLVAFMCAEYPNMGVAVAGYPEVHPDAASMEEDSRYLKLKVDAGADFVVTQLFFDNQVYFDFVDSCRAAGITVPIVPGILPILSMSSIKRILSFCNASLPKAFEAELTAAEERGGTPEVRKVGIEFASRQVRELVAGGAPGAHLYTLNKAEACLEIVKNLPFVNS